MPGALRNKPYLAETSSSLGTDAALINFALYTQTVPDITASRIQSQTHF